MQFQHDFEFILDSILLWTQFCLKGPYWTHGCPQRFRSLTSGDDLTVIAFSHLPPIFAQTISNSFFSHKHYYAQNFYLHKEMVTVQSYDSLNKACQYEFWKLLPSESFVWFLLAMLVFTDHLLQLLQMALLFLVCSFSPFSHFQKVCKNYYTGVSTLCFQFVCQNTPRTLLLIDLATLSQC